MLHPLEFKDLYNYQAAGYFGTGKEEIYAEITKFHSIAKGWIMSKYCRNANWILDIASGKG